MSEESHNEGGRPGSEAAAEGAALDASTAVSNTNIAQMPAAEGAKWSCDVCTYENFPLSRKCTMCRAPKPLLNEDIFRLQDGASALPAPDTPPAPHPAPAPPPDACGAEAVAERLKPLRISSPQGQPGASAGTKWPCPTCTYDNWPKAQKCAMCGTAGPAPRSPPPLAPPHTPPPPPDNKPPRPAAGVPELCPGPPAPDTEASRRCKRRANNADWIWLQACLGVVDGDARRVDAYLASGGDPARVLAAQEVQLLDRASAFDVGHTLVHLAIRFQRQEILTTLLSRISGGGPGLKRSPSYIAPDLASAIRRHLAGCVRYRKGGFPCPYINEFSTYYLPAEIEDLPAPIQEQLYSELLDRDAQHTLEVAAPLVNWSAELTERLGSRLYALWNRSAGDCLPDALCQAAWGVADRGDCLRGALAAALATRALFARWAAGERWAAARAGYTPEPAQLRAEWARLGALAARARSALRPAHVLALAHVLRRPLLVLGEDLVRSARGDAIGYAGFRGLYLPLQCERAHCSPEPLCLGYTRGHFSALVPRAPRRDPYICREQQEDGEVVTYLPLTDCDGKLLPVHYLTPEEAADCEGVVRRWTGARDIGGGVLAARQRLRARPLPQAQMLEEWLNHYRRLAQQTRGPFPPRLQTAEFSSDPDSDEE